MPEVIIIPSFFFMIGYVVWVSVTAWQRRQRLRFITEFHSRLLDRIGAVKDFNDFLQTEAGTRFMQELSSEPVGLGGPQERILRAAQFGAVLICLGIGLLLMMFFSPFASQQTHTSFNALGTIALSLGIGFSVSAVASYRLSSKLGLLPDRSGRTGVPAPVQS
jgi:hypothetical protein